MLSDFIQVWQISGESVESRLDMKQLMRDRLISDLAHLERALSDFETGRTPLAPKERKELIANVRLRIANIRAELGDEQ